MLIPKMKKVIIMLVKIYLDNIIKLHIFKYKIK